MRTAITTVLLLSTTTALSTVSTQTNAQRYVGRVENATDVFQMLLDKPGGGFRFQSGGTANVDYDILLSDDPRLLSCWNSIVWELEPFQVEHDFSFPVPGTFNEFDEFHSELTFDAWTLELRDIGNFNASNFGEITSFDRSHILRGTEEEEMLTRTGTFPYCNR